MKYAIVVDSACGLNKAEAEKLGFYYLPLNMTIDDKNYRDGVDLDSSNIFNYYTFKSTVKTSSFNLGEAEELFAKLSKDYDKIIVYPISKYLSGSYQTLKMLAKENPKLEILDSQGVLNYIVLECIWLNMKLKQDPSKYQEYIDYINTYKRHYSSGVIPKINDYLVKGGRLHRSAAAIAKLLKIVPTIIFDEGQLKKEHIGHIFIKSAKKVLDHKFEKFKVAKGNKVWATYVHSGAQNDDYNQICDKFKEHTDNKYYVDYIAPVVSIHTGPQAFGYTIVEVDEDLEKEYNRCMKLIGKDYNK